MVGIIKKKTIREVADGVLRKKIRTAARNISEKAFMFNREEKGFIQELSKTKII